jgi:hypothetical protein
VDSVSKTVTFEQTSTMQYLLPHADLDLYFNNGQFALDTQKQLAKDFAQYNLSFSADFTIEPHSIGEIEQQIGECLIELMKEGETRLLQLLYTIDLPEKEFLRLTTEPEFIHLLSERILLREAYKVFLRRKFST